MKSLQEIENTSFDRLEEIACDQSIRVPDDLRSSVKATVEAAAMASAASAAAAQRRARRPLWPTYALLTLAAAACVAVFFAIPRVPQDTYDDPLLAYAKVEETFARISSELDRGAESVRQVEEPLETVNRILNNTK